MSNYERSHDDDVPRFEAWLGVMVSSFVPVILALYASPIYFVPLIAIAALLFAAGLVMLRRQSLRVERARSDARFPSATSAAVSVDGEPLEMEGAEP
jgi:MFS superfamily sulfate permease-like transporter